MSFNINKFVSNSINLCLIDGIDSSISYIEKNLMKDSGGLKVVDISKALEYHLSKRSDYSKDSSVFDYLKQIKCYKVSNKYIEDDYKTNSYLNIVTKRDTYKIYFSSF